MRKYTLFLILSFLSIMGFSQISFMAEIRPRCYFDNGYKNPDHDLSDAMIYLAQRSGIACRYQKENVQAYLHFRDARVWGDDDIYSSTGQSGNSNSLVIHQSWIQLQPHKNLYVKIGRQLLVYDDQRVLSSRNWNDFQVTYDAVKVKYKYANNCVDAVLSWNNMKKAYEYYSDQRIRSTNLIHYDYCKDKNNFSMLFLLSGRMQNDTTSIISWKKTFGTGYSYKSEKWNHNINLYLQNSIMTPEYVISLSTERMVAKWKIGAGVDALSGANEKTTGFDILYGKRHGYYGYMDFFNTTPENGLVDIMAKASWKKSEKMLLSLQIHQFNYQRKPEELTQSTSLGQEIDILLKYQYLEEISFQPGYSIFLPTATFETEKSCTSTLGLQHFIYLTISGKFHSSREGYL